MIATTTTSSTSTSTTTAPTAPPITGYGATIATWKQAHTQDPNYMGFPAYGPLVSTPEGPTPRFIEVTDDGSRITLFIESLPDHTSIDSAKAAVLEELPADTIANSFFIANQGGGGPGQSCAFWNLSSVTLATVGAGGNKGSVSIEMAYDDSNGAPTYQPANINTVTFETGINDSTGIC